MATPTARTGATTAGASTVSFWPALLCWLTVMLEGYDLVVFGAVIPTLTAPATRHLGMTTGDATFVSTISLVGVGIGAAAAGFLADRLGRRLTLIASVGLFSLFTVLVPFAPNVATFGLVRFVAGLGLGACMPIALTFMSEITSSHRKATSATTTMTGYHVGAVITSALAVAVVPNWQLLFYWGGLLGLLILPIMWLKMPESNAFLQVKNAERERVPFSAVVRKPFLVVSIGVWVGSFMGLLLVYGLNTWLPKIMTDAGYSIAASLTLLLLLNVGAIIGLLTAGRIGDSRGIRSTILVWYGVSAVFLALLSIKMQNTLLLNASVLITGIFVFSAQVLIYAYVTRVYQPAVRGTALGLTSGIGRFGAVAGPWVTGTLVSAGLAYPWGFYFFAVVAVLALIAIVVIPAHLERDAAATHEGSAATTVQ